MLHMLLWLYSHFQAYVSSVLSVFSLMLQVFELNVLKVDQEKHMLQWPRWLADSGLS
jgi:hypothetical protein